MLFIMAGGALSDTVGRRMTLIWILMGLFFCILAYPFVSSILWLFVLRFLWGVAFAGYASAPAIAIDIPQDRSRGKFNAIVLLTPWLAASGFVLVASRWPAWFKSLGYGPHAALVGSFALAALLPLTGTLTTLAFLNIKSAAPEAKTRLGLAGHVRQIFAKIGEVLAYARVNRTYGVSLFIGTVARTDTLIIGSFLSLWVVNAGRVGGVQAVIAVKTAGLIAAIRFVTKVVCAPLFGIINDKVSRTTLMLVSLGMMTAAFWFFGLITNALGAMMMVGAFLLGIAESAEAIASQTLLAQEAPAHLRGSSMGVYSFLGTGSLMAISLTGGYLFDRVGFSSPLLMEGALHFLVLMIALWLLRGGGARG
jgi:MFS family permease